MYILYSDNCEAIAPVVSAPNIERMWQKKHLNNCQMCDDDDEGVNARRRRIYIEITFHPSFCSLPASIWFNHTFCLLCPTRLIWATHILCTSPYYHHQQQEDMQPCANLGCITIMPAAKHVVPNHSHMLQNAEHVMQSHFVCTWSSIMRCLCGNCKWIRLCWDHRSYHLIKLLL